MEKCKKHFLFPDIESCAKCIIAYEDVLLRWFGIKAVENFRHLSQREISLPALRNTWNKKHSS